MTVELQNKLVDNETAHGDIATDSESEGEEHVHGEHCNHGDASDLSHVLNRNEKKARQILAKLGMKPIAGIERVTLKRTKNVQIYHLPFKLTVHKDDLCHHQP